jgi:hypothetical protein
MDPIPRTPKNAIAARSRRVPGDPISATPRENGADHEQQPHAQRHVSPRQRGRQPLGDRSAQQYQHQDGDEPLHLLDEAVHDAVVAVLPL